MENQKIIRLTSFQLPSTLLTQLRMMCLLTDKSMGEFIRIAIREKISQLKEKNLNDKQL